MERLQSIDLLKIIAMFGVISLHSSIAYINPGSTGLADIIYDLGVISVPLFFMVSGYFLIPKKKPFQYYIRKSFNYIRLIVSMIILGWLLYTCLYGVDLTILYKWSLGTLLTRGPFGVFWYLWSIILCLLITPLLNNIFSNHSRIYIIVLLALWLICTFIFSNTLQGGLFETHTPALFKIYTWFFFYMLGGILNRINISKISILLPIILFAFTILYIEYFDKKINNEYASTFYLSIPVTTLCITLFLFFKNINITNNKVIQTLSQTFLPVYAVHNVIISFMPRFYDNLYLAPLINWAIISILSVAFALVVNKTPYVNKVFKV